MQYKQSIFKRTALSAAIVATLGLTACGGGDGDSPSFSSATTSGTAAKGILNKAVVTAVELASDQSEIRTLENTLTDITGAYSLTIPSSYTNGPIKISITSDVDTEMKCDISTGCGTRADDISDANSNTTVDFGEWYKPGADNIQMSALVASAVSGAELAVNVTPFTTMAAKRAMAETTLDATAVANANSEVSALLGVNVLTTKPVDITDVSTDATPQQITYAALSAAIAESADKDTDGVPDINAAIDALATGFEDGTISSTELQDIVTDAGTIFTAAGIEDTSGLVSELQSDIDNAGASGEIDPEPTDSATVSNVDKAKALVEDFRSYANEMNTTLTNPDFGGEFKNQVELTSQLINSMDAYDNPVSLFAEISTVAQDAYWLFSEEGTSELILGESYTYEFNETDTYPPASGSMTYTYTFNQETGEWQDLVTFTNVVVGSQTVNMTFDSNGQEDGEYQDISNEQSEVIGETGDYTGTYNNDVSGTITSAMSTLKVNSADFSDWDDHYRLTNDAVTYTDEGTYKSLDRVTANVALEVINEGSSVPLVFDGNVSFNTLSRLEWFSSYNSSTHEQSNTETNSAYLKNLELDGSVTYGAETIAINATASMPNAETFYNMETVTENESQWLQMSAGFGLTIDTADLQGVKLNLSTNRTAFDQAVAQLSVSHEDRSILLAFDTSLTPAEPLAYPDFMNLMIGEPQGDITVTDINGTVLTITPNGEDVGVIGAVTIDGLDVAIIERTEAGLIKTSYADNTFEIY